MAKTIILIPRRKVGGSTGVGAAALANMLNHVANSVTIPGSPLVTVDDTPVNAATNTPISSNWAFDHVANANIHHPEAHSHLTVVGTQVFSGLSPTAWTDLTLSGVVGSNAALVLLKIKAVLTGRDIAVRKNGDTDEAWVLNATEAAGAALFKSMANVHHVVIAVTDSVGVIEWRTSPTTTMTVDVIAFVK